MILDSDVAVVPKLTTATHRWTDKGLQTDGHWRHIVASLHRTLSVYCNRPNTSLRSTPATQAPFSSAEHKFNYHCVWTDAFTAVTWHRLGASKRKCVISSIAKLMDLVTKLHTWAANFLIDRWHKLRPAMAPRWSQSSAVRQNCTVLSTPAYRLSWSNRLASSAWGRHCQSYALAGHGNRES